MLYRPLLDVRALHSSHRDAPGTSSWRIYATLTSIQYRVRRLSTRRPSGAAPHSFCRAHPTAPPPLGRAPISTTSCDAWRAETSPRLTSGLQPMERGQLRLRHHVASGRCRRPRRTSFAGHIRDFWCRSAGARSGPLFAGGPRPTALLQTSPSLRACGHRNGASHGTGAPLPADVAPTSATRPSSFSSMRLRSPSPSPPSTARRVPRPSGGLCSTTSAAVPGSRRCRLMSPPRRNGRGGADQDSVYSSRRDAR